MTSNKWRVGRKRTEERKPREEWRKTKMERKRVVGEGGGKERRKGQQQVGGDQWRQRIQEWVDAMTRWKANTNKTNGKRRQFKKRNRKRDRGEKEKKGFESQASLFRLFFSSLPRQPLYTQPLLHLVDGHAEAVRHKHEAPRPQVKFLPLWWNSVLCGHSGGVEEQRGTHPLSSRPEPTLRAAVIRHNGRWRHWCPSLVTSTPPHHTWFGFFCSV